MAVDWHSDERFNQALQTFHDEHAWYPKTEIGEARAVHKRNLMTIRRKLREKKEKGLILRVAYAGSVYEGVKIIGDLEFDCMLIIDGTKNLATESDWPATPCISKLKPEVHAENADVFNQFLENEYISPEKLTKKYFDLIQMIINEDLRLKQTVKLSKHGPAIQMDVCTDEGVFWFSVELVPAIEIDGIYYVSKPFKDDSSEEDVEQDILAWRLSTSMQEKIKLDLIDRDDEGCRKMCLRILKAMGKRDATMQGLTSYHFKTALLHISEQQRSWRQDELGQRIVDIMQWLANCFETKNMPNYFNGEMNIIENIPDITRRNIVDHLKNLLLSEKDFTELLK